MNSEELKGRTKQFAIEIIKFFQRLPKKDEIKILAKQLLRSGTSIGANYSEACRARSDVEFYAKLCIVVEECDEAVYWLELIKESKLVNNEEIRIFEKETIELLSIFSASRKTVKNILRK